MKVQPSHKSPIRHPVFFLSSALAMLMIIGTLLSPDSASTFIDSTKTSIISSFDSLFAIICNLIVILCLAIMVSPWGNIRLGGSQAEPEFSTLSWLSMLFAAGMGIGLMFWSVAEPAAYYTGWFGTPLNVLKSTEEAAQLAMGSTLFHWGLHPWSLYALVGLSVAFFCFNRQLPFTIRSTFYPLLKDKTWGWMGHTVDVLAVIAALFGLATSLGLGAKQASSGLSYLFSFPDTLSTQLFIIVGVTLLATISVIRGLKSGVKVLSNINLALALLLMLAVIVLGHGWSFIPLMTDTANAYLQNIVPLSDWIGREDDTFYHGWTIFYWAWWISWSPFVGLFIARISKGRTVRAFLVSVLFVPTLLTLFWMSTFGGLGLSQIQAEVGELSLGLSNVSLALFQALQQLPMAEWLSLVAVILVLLFFVTSSDSGSLVIDNIVTGGHTDNPTQYRVFWSVMSGLIAAVLLFGGGEKALQALQAVTITISLPFLILLLLMSVSLCLGLKAAWTESTQP
jgi:BCCT family betaine/carnitine transporter